MKALAGYRHDFFFGEGLTTGRDFFGGGLLTHSKGARTSAAPTPTGPSAHSVEPKAVVRIEVAVSPRPCLGCAEELALRVAPLRRGVPPR
jgi:hypothetical protein